MVAGWSAEGEEGERVKAKEKSDVLTQSTGREGKVLERVKRWVRGEKERARGVTGRAAVATTVKECECE